MYDVTQPLLIHKAADACKTLQLYLLSMGPKMELSGILYSMIFC